MPRIAEKLNQRQIDRIRDAGRHAVGDGVYLRVRDGRRTFEARFTDARKKRVWKTLGDAEDLTLAEARRLAQQVERQCAPDRSRTWRTIDEIASEHLADHAGLWKSTVHRRQWQQTLDQYVLPEIGKVKANAVSVDMVSTILRRLSDKPETMRRVRGRIAALIDAEAARLTSPIINPADARWLPKAVRMAMSKTKGAGKVRHHEAPTLLELKTIWPRLGDKAPAHLLLRFLVLTAARVSEARLGSWDEIDLSDRIWTVPAHRMKAGEEHKVPLSDAAVAVLEAASARARGLHSPYLFPALSGGPLALDSARQRLRRMVGRAVTAHGLRSTFRDWVLETGKDRQLAELSLAHTLSGVEAAYARSKAIELRRVLMQQWADEVHGE